MLNKLIKASKNKKGFTLVELIVVLVILAILAAILVPTLIGYINKAREEKDFATAQSVRVACQAAYTDIVKDGTTANTITPSMNNEALYLVGALSQKEYTDSMAANPVVAINGTLDAQPIQIVTCTYSNGQVETIQVNIGGTNKSGTITGGKAYSYKSSSNAWKAVVLTSYGT